MPVLVPISTLPSDAWPPLPPAWQLEIGGLVLGAGTAYEIDEPGPAGFGLPDLRTSDLPRPQDHGLFFGADFFSSRKLTFDVWALAATPAAATALMDALLAVWQPPAGQDGVAPLTIRLPGLDDRLIMGRPRRLAYDVQLLRTGVVKATLQYEAADPRIYSATESLVTAALPSSTGGLVWPTGWPLVWGVGSAGSVSVTNTGNFGSRPVVTFYGQLVGLSLANVTTGKTFRMDDSYALNPGEILVVDFDAHSVLLGGTASRYGDVASTSQWFELVPGPNDLHLGAHSGDGYAEIRYRSAWL